MGSKKRVDSGTPGFPRGGSIGRSGKRKKKARRGRRGVKSGRAGLSFFCRSWISLFFFSFWDSVIDVTPIGSGNQRLVLVLEFGVRSFSLEWRHADEQKKPQSLVTAVIPGVF